MMSQKKAQVLGLALRDARLLFNLMETYSDAANADLDITAKRRAVLECLVLGGPQTVPSIAEARSVSRQNIQVIVNALLKLDVVKLVDNPNHKRSPLVEITQKGLELFEAIRNREQPVIESLAKEFDIDEVRTLKAGLEKANRFFLDQLSNPQT